MSKYTEGLLTTLANNAKLIDEWSKKAVVDGYKYLNDLVITICKGIEENVFGAFSSVFFNAIAYNLIGIIVVIWLFYHMRSGFSRDDIFKGGIWLITLAFIYGVLSSYSAYVEFKSWFLIPQEIVKASISSISKGKDVYQMLAETMSFPFDNYIEALKVGIHLLEKGYPAFDYKGNNGGDWDDIANIMWASAALIGWQALISLGIALIVLIVFIILLMTNLSLTLFGCFAPIMIMCLMTPQTRPYFFSWLKNYISISLYVPLVMLPIYIIHISKEKFKLNGGELYINTGYYTFLFFIVCCISLYIIFKLPEWINIIMGTQESHSNMAMAQSVMAGAVTMATFAGGKALGLASGTLRGAGALAKGSYKTAAATTRFARDPKGHIKAGLNNIGQKFDKVKQDFGGFTAKSEHYDNNK